jgi:D-alanine-D-alanine ligase
MKVIVPHTLPPDQVTDGHVADEYALYCAASAIAAAIPGAVAAGVRGGAAELMELLARYEPDVVFNLCEAPLGRTGLEPHAAALFEWLGIRFTGARSDTLALCRRKDLVSPILRDHGLAVPARLKRECPIFPCIVKPAAEDGSATLDHKSVCDDAEALTHVLGRISEPVVIEEFLPGREFAVSLWGRHDPDYVSVGEMVFLNGLRLITYAAKWHLESADFADSPLQYDSAIAPQLRAAIVATAKGAWYAVGARHLLRVDIRLDRAGCPRVLDVNPNPEMSPDVGISRAVKEAGWEWRDFIHKLVEWA